MPTNNLSTLIAALSSPEADTRAQAAEQLAQLGSEARPAAIALVLGSGDEAEEVRQWSTAALEEMGPPDVADMASLVSFLEGRSADVGYWAATLLGRLKSEAAPSVDALAHAVAGSPHLSVRQRAAWALGEIGPSAAAAVPALQKAAADADPRLSRFAQAAMSQIAGK